MPSREGLYPGATLLGWRKQNPQPHARGCLQTAPHQGPPGSYARLKARKVTRRAETSKFQAGFMANWGLESEKTAWRRRTWLGQGVEGDERSEAGGGRSEGSLCVSVSVSLFFSYLCSVSMFLCLCSLHFSLSLCFSSLCLHLLLCPAPGLIP